VTGGTTFVITMAINYGLKLFVIPQHPVTCLAVATIIATVVSYVMNKKWSFDDRGEEDELVGRVPCTRPTSSSSSPRSASSPSV
jgi:putative flippase GtrA